MFTYAIAINEHKSQSLDIQTILIDKLHTYNFINDQVNPNWIFVLGGDGNFLWAINKYNHLLNNSKFITIKTNDKSVGFFCRWLIDDIDQIIEQIINHKIVIDQCQLLQINFMQNNKIIKQQLSVNELRIINLKNTITFNLFINDQWLANYQASGIVISTNLGSSGYIKAIDGATILAKTPLLNVKIIAPCDGLTPITYKNFILDQSQILTIVIDEHHFVKDTYFFVDGIETIKTNQLVLQNHQQRFNLVVKHL